MTARLILFHLTCDHVLAYKLDDARTPRDWAAIHCPRCDTPRSIRFKAMPNAKYWRHRDIVHRECRYCVRYGNSGTPGGMCKPCRVTWRRWARARRSRDRKVERRAERDTIAYLKQRNRPIELPRRILG